MIKACDIFPVLVRVAGFATERFARVGEHRHARCEFAMMNVFVASGAGQIGKVEYGCSRARHRLMAVDAGHGNVPAGEREACLLVLEESHILFLEREARVAFLTLVLPGIASKLTFVRVLVAVDAECKLDLEAGLRSSRSVAVGTLNQRMG